MHSPEVFFVVRVDGTVGMCFVKRWLTTDDAAAIGTVGHRIDTPGMTLSPRDGYAPGQLPGFVHGKMKGGDGFIGHKGSGDHVGIGQPGG